MQKTKIVSFVLTAVMLVTVVLAALLAINLGNAEAKTGAMSSQDLFSMTNTYDCTSVTDSGNYEIKYASVKNDNQVMDIPQITVLTHGLGGTAADWSNQYNGEDENIFEYDKNSIIEKLKIKSEGAKLFVLKDKGSNAELTLEYSGSTTSIEDISKHIILVFEANEPNGSNNSVYYEFNHAISNIVLQVKKLNGGILPKLNLIGHSRGGLTNMQYALDHPDMVASLISIGTPYFSSTTANLFGEMLMEDDEGLSDILNRDVYMQYYNRWNDNYDTLYKNINAVAIGGYSSLTMLPLILTKDKSGFIKDYLETDDAGVAALAAAAEVALTYISGLKAANIYTAITMSGLSRLLESFFPQDKVVDAMSILTREMGFTYKPPFTAFFNDMLVSLDSQLGVDSVFNLHKYKGFKRYKRYFTALNSNFDKVAEAMPPVIHNMEPRDSQIIQWVCNEVVMGSVESGYRYKKLDDSNIAITGFSGSLDSTEVVIPSQIDGYDVVEIGDYAFNESWFSDNMTKVTIPQGVTKIGEMAFADCKALQSIEFDGQNNNISRIDENAFCGCVSIQSFPELTKLTEIAEGAFAGSAIRTLDLSAYPSLEKIGYGAFRDCKNLSSVKLGNNIKEISAFAFYGCESLAIIDIPANVEFIGEQAFSACSAMSRINVDSANSNYKSLMGVLYSKDGSTILQYPAGQSGYLYAIPQGVRRIASGAFSYSAMTDIRLNEDLREIGSFAFAYNSAIEEIAIYDMIITISPFAFADCVSLKDVTLYSDRVSSLNDNAFNNISKDAKFYVPNRALTKYCDSLALEEYASNVLPITYTLRYYDGDTLIQEKQICYLDKDDFQIAKEGYNFDHWEKKNTGEALNYEQFIKRDSTVEVEAFWRIKHFVIYLTREDKTGYLKISDGNASIVDEPTYVEYGAKARIKETIAQWYWQAVKYLGQKLVNFEFSPVKADMPSNGSTIIVGDTWVEWDDYDYAEIFEQWNSILEDGIPDFDLEFMAILITPIFETKQVTFILDANGGKLTGTSAVKLNYGDSFAISAPKKLGYDFAYWSIESLTPTSTHNDYLYKGKRFSYQTVPDMSINIPLDSTVVLKAEWANFYYIDAKTFSGTQIGGAEHILLDFKNFSFNSSVGKIFHFDNTVTKIYIKNMNSLRDVAFVFLDHEEVIIENCRFTAQNDTDAMMSLIKINLYFIGNNHIYGGLRTANNIEGSVATGTGIQTGRLNLQAGSDSGANTLSIYGGKGADSKTSGIAGVKGAYGVLAANIYIYSGRIFIYGGNGGAGYDGKSGASVSENGESGSAGGFGGQGVYVSGSHFEISQSAYVYIRGGDGGRGGNGGNGADGRNGKFGVTAKGGGDGGNGGKGGNGASAVGAILTSEYKNKAVLENGKGGTGGKKGLGGKGGLKYPTKNPTSDGEDGKDGADGKSY